MNVRRSTPVLTAVLLALTGATAGAQPCAAPASWFPHAQTQPPGTANPGADPCAFYQWSWQSFLWLTQAVDGDLRFITQMYDPSQVFSAAFLDRDNGKLPPRSDVKRASLRLRPRDSKPKTVGAVNQINQAGDNGVLIDQNGRAIYYAIHLNEVYYDFIRETGFNIPGNLMTASPLARFPVGTVEVKSAWRVVLPDEDTAGVYTTFAQLELLKTDLRGHVVVDPSNTVTQKVALVGLHVIGVVVGHDEFLWATFESDKNAPALPDGLAIDADEPVSTDGGWAFYKAGTWASRCNQPNGGDVSLTDPMAQTLTPVTHVFRQFAQGGGADGAIIQALNTSVHAQLGGGVWANYDLIGSLWSGDPLEVNVIPGNLKGSTALANATMETFSQTTGNCFKCHNTQAYADGTIALGPKKLNLSHALRQAFVTNSDYQKRKALLKVDKALPQ